jgi:hypothetical protein
LTPKLSRKSKALGGVPPIVLRLPHHASRVFSKGRERGSAALGAVKHGDLNGTVRKFQCSKLEHGSRVMDNDAASNAACFREYAEECRRLAQQAPQRDKPVLMEMDYLRGRSGGQRLHSWKQQTKSVTPPGTLLETGPRGSAGAIEQQVWPSQESYRRGNGWPTARRSCRRSRPITSYSPCRLGSLRIYPNRRTGP